MDDEELRVGEEIGVELLQAIDDSQIYVPIFSENYASRKWCLRELVRMVDNISKSKEKKILPIFYYVKPDDVDLKTESYRKAMGELKKEHEKKQQEKFPHEVESWEGELWEKALTKVGKIKGWVLQQGKSQAELLDLVVEKVLQELKIRHKSVTKDLVGLDDRVAEVLELLDVDCSDEVRLLGIHGMGGIGKTTLARVVYSELLSHFGKNCAFFDDIRETFNRKGNTGVLETIEKMKLKNSDLALQILAYEMAEMEFSHALQLFKRHAILEGSPARDVDDLAIDIVDTTGAFLWLQEIDDSIGKLKCLLDLNITNCGLIERVPDEIGGLVKLERFSLKSCYEVHGLPTSIGDLASLRKLDLSKTGITSPVH
ncbi:disease resistance protein RUN1-like [Eucalyptus grandis]|uniref:disease resistance protein RUN1-like n=1 Tax=Eucalyptus grandis TaxID=71139 RepID=UPI00192E79C6|nr:disease resistance protein RUN1-like [Eucalyptus grandis]